MTNAVQRILPVFNRCVIFASTDETNHGHPDPLTCPPGRSRKSLAVYHHTSGRPVAEQSEPHSTIYRRRPQDRTAPALDARRARRARGRLEDPTTADRMY